MNKNKPLALITLLGMLAFWLAPGTPTVQAAAPGNDNFPNATIISTLPFTNIVNTTEATTEENEPGLYGYPANNSVWYAFTPMVDTSVLISISQSDYDAVYGIYTLESGVLSLFSSMDDDYQFYLPAGITYYIQIISIDGAGGVLVFSLSEIPKPPNDDFANATVIEELPYDDSVDGFSATTEAGEPASQCSVWYGGPYRTVWYRFTPTEEGSLSGYAEWFRNFIAVYTGTSLSDLVEVTCTSSGRFIADVSPGTTYYIQVGSQIDYGVEWTNLHLDDLYPVPLNDDFADAEQIHGLPFTAEFTIAGASTEAGEQPACLYGLPFRTVWFKYTALADVTLTAEANTIAWEPYWYYGFMAVYTGSELGNLSGLDCAISVEHRFTFQAEAGETYYFQLGGENESWGEMSFNLHEAESPIADFSLSPEDPNKYDMIEMCDGSYDPGWVEFTEFWWDFGDGVLQDPSPDWCAYHSYGKDGDYTVTYGAKTADGRSAETSTTVQVRTHDVAIKKFSVARSASVGQTRPIIVGISNTLYAETVTVELYKSTPYEYSYVDALTLEVPVLPANRTVDFKFNYTFAPEDAQMGKVTFKVVAVIQNEIRDALPADNEAISTPIKVAK